MPKIIWKGIIKSEKDFPTADIPKNAKKLLKRIIESSKNV